jgi:hypothetical protein
MTVIFSGDFRQILPVVKFDEFPPAFMASIKSSPLWSHVVIAALTDNMRLGLGNNEDSSQVNKTFAATLLKIGEGRYQKGNYGILNLNGVPHTDFNNPAKGEKVLIDFVYGDLVEMANSTTEENAQYLNTRCILAPLNQDVRALNEEITRSLPGELILSKSIDLPDPLRERHVARGIPQQAINFRPA